MPMNRVSIDIPFGEDLETLYCPVCGTLIFSQEATPSCPHVAFTFISEVGEFDDVAPHLKPVIEAVTDSIEDDDRHPVEMLAERLDRPSLFCLQLNLGGMACGPVWTELFVGIDFNPD